MVRTAITPWALFLAGSFAILGSGCASYTDDTQGLRQAWSAGDVQQAAQIATTKAQKDQGGTNALLWQLEAGATTRANSQFNDSLLAFSQSENLFDYWDARPDISISGEAAATMVNQTILPYRGHAYDKIMASTYQALNYLDLGRYDEARVEINRSYQYQKDAVAANASNIASAQAAANKASAASAQNPGSTDTYDVNRAESDPQFQANVSDAYGDLDNLKFYAPYVNPFSVYLEGLYFLGRGETNSDFERARVAFKRVRDLIGSNSYIDADYALADSLAGGGTLPPLTYVIFETGQAPIRSEIRIDIPLFIVSRSVPYVGVAFPKLVYNNEFCPGLTVSGANTTPLHTTLLCNMDLVIGQDFKNELPTIIIKTLISAGAKAAAQYGLYAATKNSGDWAVVAEIAGVVYQAATNQADLRTWVTLPKEFTYCRLPTPPDRRLVLTADGSGQSETVDLPPGLINVVYVKSNSYADRLLVHTITLR
ncbi:MAG: hypothetical protein ABSH19_04740 [Opitutales bacterium]|jgi:hypothetical protein